MSSYALSGLVAGPPPLLVAPLHGQFTRGVSTAFTSLSAREISAYLEGARAHGHQSVHLFKGFRMP